MELIFSNRFKKDYKLLNNEQRKIFKQKIKLFEKNPFYPSLRTKKIQGKEDLFECSINMSIRMTWQYFNNIVLLRAIGEHDHTLKNP